MQEAYKDSLNSNEKLSLVLLYNELLLLHLQNILRFVTEPDYHRLHPAQPPHIREQETLVLHFSVHLI